MSEKIYYWAISGTRELDSIDLENYHEFETFMTHFRFDIYPIFLRPTNCVIILGKANNGIDVFAERYAREHNFKTLEYSAKRHILLSHSRKGNRYDRRNSEMAVVCDVALTFPSFNKGKISGGTANFIKWALRLKKDIYYLNSAHKIVKYF